MKREEVRRYLEPGMAVVWNLGLAYVVYMLARVVFLVKNYSYFEQGLTWGHLMEMFGGGLVFDTAAILVTNIPYIVLALLLPWKKPTKWVYMIINSVALAMNLADSVYFKYTMRRTTTTVFSEFQNEGNLGGIIGTEVLQQWYLVVLFGVVVYGIWRLYKESGDRSQESGDRSQETGVRRQESGENSKPKVFVAGSSWPPDEEIFIKYFNEHKDWKLIIAPHVIGEDHLQQIEKKLEGWNVTRYTKAQTTNEAPSGAVGGASALIIDCFGLLSSIYRYADVAYVGGGFGVGIHNLLEAAVWDVPVIFGPNNQKFQEAQGLKKSGGFEIHDYDEFAALMDRFTADADYLKTQGQRAGAFVQSLAGATEKILSSVSL